MEKLNSLEQLDDHDNLEKYKVGGQIVFKVINNLIKKSKINTDIYELCLFGDKMMLDELKNVYKNKKFKHGRGISFPTCISVNNNAGYYIPTEKKIIKDGDVLKIELGVHLDGFPSVMCKTILVCQDENEHLEKKKLINIVNKSAKDVLKMLKDGLINKEIIKRLEKNSQENNFNLLTCNGKYMHGPGVITYQMSQNNIDGKTEDDYDTHQLLIPRMNETFDFEMGEMELNENEVYCFDIGMSTGNGKLDLDDGYCRIYKRNIDKFYSLKLKTSKEALGKFKNNYFPMNVTKLVNSRFKMGLNECINNNLIESYPSMIESDNDIVARIKFTVVIRRHNKKKNKKGYILITDFN